MKTDIQWRAELESNPVWERARLENENLRAEKQNLWQVIENLREQLRESERRKCRCNQIPMKAVE